MMNDDDDDDKLRLTLRRPREASNVIRRNRPRPTVIVTARRTDHRSKQTNKQVQAINGITY